MSQPFDPYRKWLGIPPKDQPPNHYRLLGIAHFEDDPDVIENAATRQMAHVRTFQSGKYSSLSQKLLNELTAAKLCLLQLQKKVPYDDQLRSKLSAEGKLSSDNLLVTSEVDEPETEPEAPPYEEPPMEQPPEIRRSPAIRWKTETEDILPAEPPIVPIPMPMGTAVAAPPRLSPSIPLGPTPLMLGAPSRSSYRRKSSSAAVPLTIAIIGLVILFGGGIVAVVLSGAFSKSPEKHPKKTSSAPTNFPVGTAAKVKELKENSVVASFPPKTATLPEAAPGFKSSPKPAESVAVSKKPVDRGAIEDELRQALFHGRQALEKREPDMCKGYVVTAETLLDAHPGIDSKLGEQVRMLRELLDRNGEFWSLVRDAAINGKVATGEKFNFRKEEFELVSHEGELVTYKLAGKEHSAPVQEIHAQAALALAYHSTKDENGKRLALVAFGMSDKRAKEEHFDNNWAKNLYTRLALNGHASAHLARELGVEEKPDPAKTKVPEGDDDPPSKGKPDSK